MTRADEYFEWGRGDNIAGVARGNDSFKYHADRENYNAGWFASADQRNGIDSLSYPKTAGEIAATAASYVGGERQETHGEKGACFRCMKAADDFIENLSIITHEKDDPPAGVQAALRMILYKMARVYAGGKHNLDDYIDMAGYAACAGEVAEIAHHNRD